MEVIKQAQQEILHNDVERENILQNTIATMEVRTIAVKVLVHDIMEVMHVVPLQQHVHLDIKVIHEQVYVTKYVNHEHGFRHELPIVLHVHQEHTNLVHIQ